MFAAIYGVKKGGVQKLGHVVLIEGLDDLVHQAEVLNLGKGVEVDIVHTQEPAEEEAQLKA